MSSNLYRKHEILRIHSQPTEKKRKNKKVRIELAFLLLFADDSLFKETTEKSER